MFGLVLTAGYPADSNLTDTQLCSSLHRHGLLIGPMKYLEFYLCSFGQDECSLRLDLTILYKCDTQDLLPESEIALLLRLDKALFCDLFEQLIDFSSLPEPFNSSLPQAVYLFTFVKVC